ncbi:hypothetical protein ACWKT5_19635 [Streptomyces avermitilis]
MTGLPIHPAVQNLLDERHGPVSLSATRELDDLAEAVQQAGHPWTGQDLLDLATVTLAATHHSAHPGLRGAAYAYLDQLAAEPSVLGSVGFAPAEEATNEEPLWLKPAMGLGQYADIGRGRLMDSLTEFENDLNSPRDPADATLDILNARALELAAAASRVIRARREHDPKAEDRLKVLARRRLEELERVAWVAATSREDQHLFSRSEMTISREQMRTALIEEGYARLEWRRQQQASAAGVQASCVGRAQECLTESLVPQRAEVAMEDRA